MLSLSQNLYKQNNNSMSVSTKATASPSNHMACHIESTKSPTPQKVASAFPKALTNKVLIDRVTYALMKHGYNRETTILATSLCCDELNRELEKDLAVHYGDNFTMGGLAGFAFGGVTSFGAMADHIPDGGSCLVVYGPHVGVDSAGFIGKIDRRGRKASNACCGSATAAAAYVASVRRGAEEAFMPTECIDIQQYFVGKMLLPHGERLEKASDASIELSLALFDEQDKLMHKIVTAGCGGVPANSKIALLGGVQINTPPDCPDYFLPLKFELLDNKGRLLTNLLWDQE